MREIDEGFIEDLMLDAALHALPGVAATFGLEIENRGDVISHKANRLGEAFAEKWLQREADRNRKIARILKNYNEQQ